MKLSLNNWFPIIEEAEKEQIVSMIKETLIEQEPEVITYEVPSNRIRTQTETAKPVQQFCDAINPPTPIVIQQDSVAESEVYQNRLHIDPDSAN